jgi:hypothetical protein|tara:strand:- start:169 stop:420 length:252 start_codon:yes stop_codon:yes gene_type:complete
MEELQDFDEHIAFLNSYDVIINKKNTDDFVESDFNYFVHNPAIPPRKENVMEMLDYFEEIEDYERCSKIKLYLNEKRNSKRTE